MRCFGGLAEVPAGVELHPPERRAFAAQLMRCEAIVGSAGSNLLSEAVLLGKPVLALHAARDHEQRLNGQLIAQAGVGETASLDTLSPGTVTRFLQRVAAGDFARVDLETGSGRRGRRSSCAAATRGCSWRSTPSVGRSRRPGSTSRESRCCAMTAGRRGS